MAVRKYSNLSPRTTLVGAINNSVTAITIDDDPVVSAPFAAVITPSPDKAGEEIVLVTVVTPNAGDFDLTVTRGYGGTTAVSHSNGALFEHVVIADDFIQNNDEATTAPGVGDDSNDGYSIGSRWIDAVLNRVYFCFDASIGAADWRLMVIATNTAGDVLLIGTLAAGSSTITIDNIGESITDGTEDFALVNTTAAADGAQQFSPAIRFLGRGWDEGAAESQTIEFRGYVETLQGATEPTGNLKIEASINGGTYFDIFRFATNGTMVISGKLAIGDTPNPSMYFAPSSGATTNAQWHQSADILALADLGVGNLITIDLTNGNTTYSGTLAASNLSGTNTGDLPPSDVNVVLHGQVFS